MCDRARRQKRVSASFFADAVLVPFALALRRARPVLWTGGRFACPRRVALLAARRRTPAGPAPGSAVRSSDAGALGIPSVLKS